MHRRPFGHQTQSAGWKPSTEEGERFNVDHGPRLGILGMEEAGRDLRSTS